MKKLIIIAAVIFSVIACSENEDKFTSEGLITGIDTRECSCCGGYFIEIKDSTYRFYELPNERNFNLDYPVFPIPVKLDWKQAANQCLGDEIEVIRIILK